MFNKILVATDLLSTCDAPVLTAIDLAKQSNAKLYILHLLESAYSDKYRNFVQHFKTGEEIVSNAEYEGSVNKTLKSMCSGALNGFDNYEIMVTPGLPWEQIIKLARKERVDLIVLGPHVRRAEEKGVARVSGTIGSTVEGVVMRERCPVMIVNQPVPPDHLKFKNIMVCIDFSRSCEYALRFAAKIAKEEDAKLFLFNMFPVGPPYRYHQSDLEKILLANDQKLEEFSKDFLNSLHYECKVWEGTMPFLEILKYAREKDIELIAMGSHIKEKDERWYVGSAVEQVSARSNCPVAVVTNPRALLQMESIP